ncbi:hypothetical protein [Metabacillus halosaccharovorans]|uniref:hypothetical protein n=1 Tax=Metabacillus halosaccharovorans TaxID=930124 RepID=UPI00203BA60D|nr:hypothetical protein [Metabacillus halosaccharovorans]MCM3444388.1 hypothetical protein [Metabacillus halosaccharovorans]
MLVGLGLGVVFSNFVKKLKLIFKDEFNRVNNDLLGNGWQYYSTDTGFQTTFGVDNNQMASKTSTTSANTYRETGISDNMRISAKFSVYANFSGITFRRSADPLLNTMVSLRSIDATTMRVDRWVGGSNNTTIMTLSGLTLTNGDIWSVECRGSEIKIFQNGILRGTVNEPSGQSNTCHGIVSSGNTASRFDDFTVEEIA